MKDICATVAAHIAGAMAAEERYKFTSRLIKTRFD